MDFLQGRLLGEVNLIRDTHIVEDWNEIICNRNNRNKMAKYVGTSCESMNFQPGEILGKLNLKFQFDFLMLNMSKYVKYEFIFYILSFSSFCMDMVSYLVFLFSTTIIADILLVLAETKPYLKKTKFQVVPVDLELELGVSSHEVTIPGQAIPGASREGLGPSYFLRSKKKKGKQRKKECRSRNY